MALPLAPGLIPSEIAFLCEMELVTVIPRQRLDSLPLLSGPTPLLRPPHRSSLPLWLALLLKRQRRASIVPPPWLHPASLTAILDREIGPKASMTGTTDMLSQSQTQAPPPTTTTIPTQRLPPFTPTTPLPTDSDLTPPFQPSSTSTTTTNPYDDTHPPTLPYHYLELSTLLLTHAADDIPDPASTTRLLRDIREVRLAKLRALTQKLGAGAGVDVSGIGAMEVGEGRGFLCGVVDGLRGVEGSREVGRRERREEEEGGVEEGDEDMEL